VFFAAPLWLLLVLPWIALVLLLVRRRHEPTSVPFLQLWRDQRSSSPSRTTRAIPPLPILAILLSILLLILAAASPRLRARTPQMHIAIIVDRGLTTLPDKRFASALQKANHILLDRFAPASPVTLIAVPFAPTIDTTLADWVPQALALPHVGVASDGTIQQAIAAATSPNRVVVAITDQPLQPDVVAIAPDPVTDNVGIVHLAARQSPQPEVMVRLRNQSPRDQCSLKLLTASATATQTVALPPQGKEKDYFFKLPKLGDVLSVAIDEPDDFPLDNHRYLARESSFPKFEIAPNVPAEIRRVVEAYSKTHPPAEHAPAVTITSDEAVTGPAVVVALNAQPLPAAQSIQVATHPVTANVQPAAFESMNVALPPKQSGWLPLISAGGRPLLASRDKPSRQIWFGFSSPAFSSTTQFVILWTNILSSFTPDDADFISHPVAALSDDWKPIDSPGEKLELSPGIYRRSDGSLRASNIAGVWFPSTRGSDPSRILNSHPILAASAIELARPLSLAALLLLLVAAATFPAARLIPASTRP
jgi:hypothetical protein